MSEKELRDLLSSASAQLPPEGDLLARAEGRGRTIRRRRRILTGVGATGLVAAVAFAAVLAWPNPTAVTVPVADQPTPTAQASTPDPARDAEIRKSALLTKSDLPTSSRGEDLSWNSVAAPESGCTSWDRSNPVVDRVDPSVRRAFALDGDGRFWTEVFTEADSDAARARVASVAAQVRSCADALPGKSLWKPVKETTLPDAGNARLLSYEVTCENPDQGCGIAALQIGVASVGRYVVFVSFSSNGGVTDDLAGEIVRKAIDKLEAAAN